jgi:DMSO/TMAO reductase YedYZ molybdopterin-dependent catalytic subunit
MKLTRGGVLVTFLVVVVLVIYIIDLTGFPGPAGVRYEVKTLPSAEIRDYKGEKLSSVSDFRENSIKGPQYIDPGTYRLNVQGLVSDPWIYSYDELLTKYPAYQKVVTLHCVEGWDVTILWEGILVRDILNDAGVRPESDTIIFRAQDGYSTSFPLSYMMDNDILMAYRINNVTLPAERGYPFQLVAEDKWGYKWIKWITAIELSDNPAYKGYWESRGYSNTGNLQEGFFS